MVERSWGGGGMLVEESGIVAAKNRVDEVVVELHRNCSRAC